MNAFYATFADTSAVDEDSLREALEYVGVPLRLEQWNTEASADAIRHYAMGIGDPNPLWQDQSYARGSAQGGIVAPPTFLYSVYVGFAPGLPGLPAYLRRSEWRFVDWVRLGDQLRASATLRDAALVENRHGAKRIHQYARLEYVRTTATGASIPIAICDDTVVRPPGPGHQGALAYEPRPEHSYSEAELGDIERAVLAVHRRGPQPRYWDGVEVGDQVDRIVKGPYTRMTMLCYHMGAAGAPNYRAFDIWWHNRHLARTDPGALPASTINPGAYAGTGVTPLGHHDSGIAQILGMPGVYDNGPQRTGLLANCLTNWMGDHGFLHRLTHDLRAPVILGDTLFIEGTVTGKPAAIDESEPAPLLDAGGYGPVEIGLTATNQLSKVVSTADAVVLLPRRS
jgi:acyl dehydratase